MEDLHYSLDLYTTDRQTKILAVGGQAVEHDLDVLRASQESASKAMSSA